MIFNLLYRGTGELTRPENNPPDPQKPVNGVVLGDKPSQSPNGGFRVPLVGLPGYSPVECLLIAAPATRYDGTEDLARLYDIVERAEDPSVQFASGFSRQGMFELSTPPLPKGKYQLWVAAFTDEQP